jgi:hypothetical protein
MENVFIIFKEIFLGIRSCMLSVNLGGGVTWWHLFCAIWIFGILLGAIGFLFKIKGDK